MKIFDNLIEKMNFKKYRTFLFEQSFKLKPVETEEEYAFCDLIGYEKQKAAILNNTKAFLQGLKVNNILLYGDAGCGKSTTVRALLNEFSEIKIVQVFKDNLINLDKLFEKLKKQPYKFIVFADDISFDGADSTFSTMKATLEGSIVKCPSNVVIYATSNRRHLVKESFQSRMGDEIHLKDTISELNSLSERFGLNLLFAKPSNEEFLEIAKKLAEKYLQNYNEEEVLSKIKRHCLIKGTNSPRVIQQAIDLIKANVEF